MAYVLLDIDGVLNPLGLLNRHEAGDTFVPVSHSWGTWRLSASYHGPLLKELLAAGHDDIVWMSTWGEKSNRCGAALGLLSMPHIDVVCSRTNFSDKYETAVSFIKNNEEEVVVVLDDGLSKEEVHKLNKDLQVFALTPDPDIGYTAKDHKSVMKFLSALDG